jgi:predicted DNA-binding transcriptional regulator AlpA
MTRAKKPSAQIAPAKKAARLKAESKVKSTRPTSDDAPRVESDAPLATPISASSHGPRGPPLKHHIDKRAAALAAEDGDDDELMTVVECASWLGVSVQWLDDGRSKGYGPPFVRLSRNMVRYRRAEVRAWLIERTFASTSEYDR